MTRTAAGFSIFILFIAIPSARGQEKFDAALKKLMPKDQLEISEKMEDLTQRHSTLLFRIRDAGKRKIENEQLGTEMRQIQDDLGKKVKSDGLKSWIGRVGIIMPGNVLVLDSWQPIQLCLHLPSKAKAHGPVEEALVAMKINEGVRFTTKPDPTYFRAVSTSKTFHGFDQQINLETITSVEKVPLDPPPATGKAVGGKKKP
jgi:hypothetical protein